MVQHDAEDSRRKHSMYRAKFALEHSAVCMPLVLDLTIINLESQN